MFNLKEVLSKFFYNIDFSTSTFRNSVNIDMPTSVFDLEKLRNQYTDSKKTGELIDKFLKNIENSDFTNKEFDFWFTIFKRFKFKVPSNISVLAYFEIIVILTNRLINENKRFSLIKDPIIKLNNGLLILVVNCLTKDDSLGQEILLRKIPLEKQPKGKDKRKVIKSLRPEITDERIALNVLKVFHIEFIKLLSTGDLTTFQNSIEDLTSDVEKLVSEIVIKRFQKEENVKLSLFDRDKKQTDKIKEISTFYKLKINSFSKYLIDIYTILVKLDKNVSFEIIRCLINIFYVNRSIYISVDLNDVNVINKNLNSVKAVELKKLTEKQVLDILPEFNEIMDSILLNVKIENNFFDSKDFLDPKTFHISSKNGPNGQGAISKIPLDAIALLKDSKLYGHLQEWCKRLGIKGFEETISSMTSEQSLNLLKSNYTEEELKNCVHSRLAFINDVGGKQRTVAEVDFFSQNILKPVELLFQAIVKFDSVFGGAFDQEKSFERMVPTIKRSKQCVCADLTAATDYLPITLQEMIVERVLFHFTGKPGLGKIWADIVADRDFEVKGLPDKIRYGVGQPMGAKSSWIIMHFTHYVIAEIAKRRALKMNPNQELHFQIVGDDIIQNSFNQFDLYYEIMTSLNVKINLSKTFKSNLDTSPFFIYEYLKIIGLGDSSFRPISPRAASSFFKRPGIHFYEVLNSFIKNGLDFDLSDFLIYLVKQQNHLRLISTEEELSVFRIPSTDKTIENFFSFVYASPVIGGLGLTEETILKRFQIEGIQNYFLIFRNKDLTDNQQALFLINKLNKMLSRKTQALEANISSIVGEQGLIVIKTLFNQKVNFKNESLDEFIKNDYKELKDNKFLSCSPLFQILIYILFFQKSEIEGFRKIHELMINDLSKKADLGKINQNDLEILNDLIKRSKKIQPLTLETILPIGEIEKEVSVFGLPYRLVQHLKVSELKRIHENQIKEWIKLAQLDN